MILINNLKKITLFFGNNLIISKDEFVLKLDVSLVKKLLLFLKDHENLMFKMLVDVFVIDYPNEIKRFHLIYSLLSLKNNFRLKIKLFLDEFSLVPSIVSIYKSACWMEREVWDMNGIFFENNPDLRRILTDYGFEGHPLRKDFPLSGYVEVRYDDSQKRVIIESIELTQEYRVFNFDSSTNSWNK